jgi:starvation-inducible DNA-binding protein
MIEQPRRRQPLGHVDFTLPLPGQIAQDSKEKDSNSHSVILTDAPKFARFHSRAERIKLSVMKPTRNNIPAAAREQLVPLLNARLADATDLKSQVKQAHWNVKGPQFISLHELFDAIAGRLDAQIDEIAERAVQLGGTAAGTIRQAAAASTLPEYPAGITSGLDHATAVADRLAAYGAALRAAIDTATALGDADTADLFTGFSREADKDLWFVEAHLQ